MPRSLAYCYEKICSNMHYLEEHTGDKPIAHKTAEDTLKSLKKGSIRDVMDQGLHEFLEEFIGYNNKLGAQISEGYRFY